MLRVKFQIQLLHPGHHDPIARVAGRLQCRSKLVIFPLGGGELRDHLHQISVILHLQPGALRQRVVEQVLRQLDLRLRHAAAQVNGPRFRALHVLLSCQGLQAGL